VGASQEIMLGTRARGKKGKKEQGQGIFVSGD